MDPTSSPVGTRSKSRFVFESLDSARRSALSSMGSSGWAWAFHGSGGLDSDCASAARGTDGTLMAKAGLDGRHSCHSSPGLKKQNATVQSCPVPERILEVQQFGPLKKDMVLLLPFQRESAQLPLSEGGVSGIPIVGITGPQHAGFPTSCHQVFTSPRVLGPSHSKWSPLNKTAMPRATLIWC